MTPGSEPQSPYAVDVSRFAGMCSGPVEPLLLATEELGDVDVVEVVAAAGAGTVEAAAGLVIPLELMGVEAFCGGGAAEGSGAGGGLSSYKLPFIIAHQVTPEEFPVPVAGDATPPLPGTALSYSVAAVHAATWSEMVMMVMVGVRGRQRDDYAAAPGQRRIRG